MTSLTDLGTSVAPGSLAGSLRNVARRARGARGVHAAPLPATRTRPGAGRLPLLVLADVVAALLAVAVLALTGGPFGLRVVVALASTWVGLLAVSRTYQAGRVAVGATETTRRVLRAGVALTLGCLLLAPFTALPDGSALLLVAGTASAVSLAPRLVAHARATSSDHAVGRRVLVAANHPDDAAQVVAELRRDRSHAFELVAVCVDEPGEETTFGVPVTTDVRRLAAHATECGAEAVIAIPSHELDAATLRRIGWELELTGTQLYVGTPLLDVACGRATMAPVAGLRMLHVESRTRRVSCLLAKELLERPLAALMLLVLAPVFVAVTIAVRRDTPGPALYRQTRIGRDGVGFTMLKFRTMTTDADRMLAELSEQNESDGKLFKMRQDPRITKVGAVLRKYSLDELPQLINVVLGHMSLVGPRPALPSEVVRYDYDECRRLALKPGITGLWQVSGRSDLSWQESVRLDLKYVDNWSLAQDVVLLARTASAVLSHRGAY
ncbi:sugar transferase [Nocardioides sp. GCM10027113]|uniref:sugar transferase n=1 Tax=unclassified Nocardioides TaxID=2615069 RepID=UPI00361F31AC